MLFQRLFLSLLQINFPLFTSHKILLSKTCKQILINPSWELGMQVLNRLDDLRKHGDLLLSQAFTYAALSLTQMANMELQLNLQIEFPQLINPDKEVQIRTSNLQALNRNIKQG